MRKPSTLRVPLRATPRQRTHHREIASVFRCVRQTAREQRELRAAAPSFGNRAGAGKERHAIFAHTQRAGRDRAPLMLREKQTRVRTIGVDAGGRRG